MKKTYIIPTMTVITLSHIHQLLAGSQEGIGGGEQPNGSALSRENSFWDDEEE